MRKFGLPSGLSHRVAMMKKSREMCEREHAERMLKRAQRQQARALKLVEKWRLRIANLDRAGLAVIQPRLWPDELEIIPPTSPPPAP